ncbi:MAG: response regulator [Rhodospirillaceae bacterium]|nr:response regulator [Rhodospirillaceae bacterium]
MGQVLIIDDDSGVRDTFWLTLEACGHNVTTAAGGAEGLAAASKNTPDLIFLDLKMPGMNGVEILQKLQDICPQVPVYVVTGFYEEFLGPLRDLQAKGVPFEVARKPLGFNEIRAISEAVLAPRGKPISVTAGA